MFVLNYISGSSTALKANLGQGRSPPLPDHLCFGPTARVLGVMAFSVKNIIFLINLSISDIFGTLIGAVTNTVGDILDDSLDLAMEVNTYI